MPRSEHDLVTGAAVPARAPPGAGLAPEAVARFAGVDTWVFDLDNTLYPAGGEIWPRIDARITHFVSQYLGIDGMSARGLQKYYYRRYGTTLRGLIEEHALRPEEFLAFVHDIDRSSLNPNPALVEAVAALPGRKLILTNGSREHALRTTERLGFLETFEAVFDIAAADFIPKPDAAAYDLFFALHAVVPERAAMFEDIARNLAVPHARGMATVLVVPSQGGPDNRETWEQGGGREAYVDFVTDDLAVFLASLELAKVSPRGGANEPS